MHCVPRLLTPFCAFTVLAVSAVADEPLRTVEALRALPPMIVAAGREVQLSGVLTYLRDTPKDFNFIVDDGTGGVMVYPSARLPLRLGQRVTVAGTTRLDRPFLRIHATEVKAGETGALPSPQRATLAELMAGRFEGRYVQMEEVVRVARLESAELTPRRLALDFGPHSSRLTAWISHYDGSEKRWAAGARVRVTGVCLRWRNDRAQPVSTSLVINSPEDVVDVAPAPPLRPEPLTDLLLWTGFERGPGLHATQGNVTFFERGELVVVQEAGRALRARSAPADALVTGENGPPLAVGARVEIRGFPVLGEYTTELEDARWRVLGPGENVAPEFFPDAGALLATAGLVDRDARLVSLPATVREERSGEVGRVLELASAGHAFSASLPAGEALRRGIRAGAEVRVTGICTLHLSEERRRLGRHPGDFSLQLRGPQDLALLRAAP